MNDHNNETDFAVPTGGFIEEWLDDNNINQAELARRMGVSAKHVSKLVNGAPLSPDVALKLSLVTDIPQGHWMNLEATYRADIARLAAQEEFAAQHVDLLREFTNSASDLRKRGFLSEAATMHNPGRLMLELLAFFKVGSPESLAAVTRVHSAAFRNSTAHVPVNASVATWLRLGSVQMESQDTEALPPFDIKRAHEAIGRMARISGRNPAVWSDEIEETLKSGGIAISYVDGVKGCRAYGATQWLNERPLVQLSLREKNDGQFWFTLMHELGHVVLQPQIDVTDLDPDAASDTEEEANKFAIDRLVPQVYRDELESLNSDAAVHHFADKLGISPGIVVGQLHRNKHWHYSRGRHHFRKLTIREDD